MSNYNAHIDDLNLKVMQVYQHFNIRAEDIQQYYKNYTSIMGEKQKIVADINKMLGDYVYTKSMHTDKLTPLKIKLVISALEEFFFYISEAGPKVDGKTVVLLSATIKNIHNNIHMVEAQREKLDKLYI